MNLQEWMNSEEGRELAEQIGKSMHDRMRREQDIKRKNFEILNQYAREGAIVFTGSSLMELFPIVEIAASAGIEKTIYNRGIGGTTTDDFLAAIDTVTLIRKHPSRLFLNIGTNDMTDRVYGDNWMEHLTSNYDKILAYLRSQSPKTEIFCMAFYPANQNLPGAHDDPGRWGMLKDRTVSNIRECSRRVKVLAEKHGCRFIDVNEGLALDNGEQKPEFAIDGVHMYASAYEIIFQNLRQYLS